MSTKVGIVGSGIVGQTLANGFVKHGYDVTLCMLWCIPGFLDNSWTHAFKLLKR